MSKINVAILGSGPLAKLCMEKIQARADLTFLTLIAGGENPPSDADCLVYLPSALELTAGDAATRILSLLQQGFNVVTPVPAEAMAHPDLLNACKQGNATFHGSGGFQNSLPSRFNRAFSTITRDIRKVELTEERSVESQDDNLAASSEPYYKGALHTLAEAVFGDALEKETTSSVVDESAKQDELTVFRSLGDQVVYVSKWTHQTDSAPPLRYRLRTVSEEATGITTITFNNNSDTTIADHLTCKSLLNAITAACNSAPGILHHDLEINYVMPDNRL